MLRWMLFMARDSVRRRVTLGLLVCCGAAFAACEESRENADERLLSCGDAPVGTGHWYRLTGLGYSFSATVLRDSLLVLDGSGWPFERDLRDDSSVSWGKVPLTDAALDVGMGAGPEHLLLMSGDGYAYAHLWDGLADEWRTLLLPSYLAPLPNYEVHFTGDAFAVYGASNDVSDKNPMRPIGALDIASGTWSDWRGAGAPDRVGTSAWTASGLFVWASDGVRAPAAWFRGLDGVWRSLALGGGPTASGGGVATWRGDVIVGANGEDQVWRYAPASDSWTGYPYPDDIVSLASGRRHHRLISVVGDRAIIATTCEYFALLDLTNGEWSVTPASEDQGAPPFDTLVQLGAATRFVVYGKAPNHDFNAEGPIWVWAPDDASAVGDAGAGGAP